MRICGVVSGVVVAVEHDQLRPIAEDVAGRSAKGPENSDAVDLMAGVAVLGVVAAEDFGHGVVELSTAGTGSGHKEEY